jgi:hypothetical protein
MNGALLEVIRYVSFDRLEVSGLASIKAGSDHGW